MAKVNAQRDIKSTDRAIGELTFELYGLSDLEIKTIEEKV